MQQKRQRYEQKDFYCTLNVSPLATAPEIKRHYRNLAVQWHPDKHPEGAARDQATEIFQQISEAYEVLLDDAARKDYDAVWNRAHRGRGTRVPEWARGAGQRAPSVQRAPSAGARQGADTGGYAAGAAQWAGGGGPPPSSGAGRKSSPQRRSSEGGRGGPGSTAGANQYWADRASGGGSASKKEPPPPKAKVTISELRRQAVNADKARDTEAQKAREADFREREAETKRREDADRRAKEFQDQLRKKKEQEDRRAWEDDAADDDRWEPPARGSVFPPGQTRPSAGPRYAWEDDVDDTEDFMRQNRDEGRDEGDRRDSSRQQEERKDEDQPETSKYENLLRGRQSGSMPAPKAAAGKARERSPKAEAGKDTEAFNVSGIWSLKSGKGATFSYMFEQKPRKLTFTGGQIEANGERLAEPARVTGSVEGNLVTWSITRSGIRCEAYLRNGGLRMAEGRYWASGGEELGTFSGDAQWLMFSSSDQGHRGRRDPDATPTLDAFGRPVTKALCKYGCGCAVAPGNTSQGKPFDTCCRTCGVGEGRNGHDATCPGFIEQAASELFPDSLPQRGGAGSESALASALRRTRIKEELAKPEPAKPAVQEADDESTWNYVSRTFGASFLGSAEPEEAPGEKRVEETPASQSSFMGWFR